MPAALESLLDNPWPVAVVLAVVAAGLQVTGLRRGNRGLLRVAPAVLLVAAAVVVAAYLVETDAEGVERGSRELVAATDPLNLPAFTALLDTDARLLRHDGALWLGRAELLANLERLTTRATLDQRIIDLAVDPAGPDPDLRTATLELRTRATGTAAGGLPLLTTWRLTWQRRGDTWRLADAQWLLFNGQPPSRELIR